MEKPKMTKELWEKAKAAGKLKRLEKPADADKLSDAEMANVAGGFIDDNFEHGAWQQWIQCPECYETRRGKFTVVENDITDYTVYRCKACGCEFMVDNEGFTCAADDVAALLMLGLMLS